MGNIVTQSTCTSTSVGRCAVVTARGVQRRRLVAAFASTVVVLGAAGCSASDDESSSAATDAAATTVAAASATTAPSADAVVSLSGEGTGSPSSPGGSPVALPNESTPFGTALAITASVTVEVPDVRQAVIDLPDLVAAKGGAIFDSQIEVGDPERATATITVKVRPQDLERLISGLSGIGKLTGRTQETEDVTDQIADIESRLATAQASVDRVRALLDSAVDLDDVVKIENELTIRETALEQLLAGQRNVSGRVQLATLTINLAPSSDALVAKIGSKADEPRSIGGALKSGWNRFVTIVHGAVVVLAYLAPLLGLMLIAGVGMLLAGRLRRHPSDGDTSGGPVPASASADVP